jgi:hypothetical protein
MSAPASERPTTLALNNDLDFVLDGTTVEGDRRDDLSFRGFIGASRGATVPIDASLSVALVAEGAGTGDYLGTISGVLLNTFLRAQYLGQVVWVITESIPAGAYRDAFPLVVVEDQGG